MIFSHVLCNYVHFTSLLPTAKQFLITLPNDLHRTVSRHVNLIFIVLLQSINYHCTSFRWKLCHSRTQWISQWISCAQRFSCWYSSGWFMPLLQTLIFCLWAQILGQLVIFVRRIKRMNILSCHLQMETTVTQTFTTSNRNKTMTAVVASVICSFPNYFHVVLISRFILWNYSL